MKEPIITFKNYSFQYLTQKEPTLKNINLEIYSGEKVLIAGASGSGKSTLGSCINGLIPFMYNGETTGELRIDGKNPQTEGIFGLSSIVGTVLQDTDGQFVGLTVAEDIAFALENQCVAQDKMIDLVRDTAAMVDVESVLQSSPYELSGGQKQRVSLAGVMVDDVKILLFDEPLANLDPHTGRQAIELIDRIRKETGATIIIIEHRIEDVLWKYMDRIVLMDNGMVIDDLETGKMLSSGLLSAHGIREPLYVTAMKYAGIAMTDDKNICFADSLRLSEEDKNKLQSLFGKRRENVRVEDKRDTVLKLNGVTFGYTAEKTILQDISFELKKGEMVSIVGKNGAGKSTLTKLICGFEMPNAGTIELEGRDISGDSISKRAEKIGYVMQNPNQMISKPLIWEEVELSLLSLDMSEEKRRERILETLRICGLYEYRSWPVSALSFGQKKRVTIASILVKRPEIIFLDEPTAGQDYRHYTEIMEFLRELNAMGYTIVMVTHDMHLMLEYSERAIVFSGGEIVCDSTPANVLSNQEVIRQSNLKETSLFYLSKIAGNMDSELFTNNFITYEREVVRCQKQQS